MLGLALDAQGLQARTDLPEPQPAAGEVVIDVLKAGLCETDRQLVRGYMGFQGILGHEFVGRATHGRYAGRRVVGEINCSCLVCPTCRSGLPTHCPQRTVLGILGRDGAFAERVALPEGNLHLVPDGVSDDAAVFVEPLAAAFQILEQVDIAGRRVMILGDGRLGQLCAQVLARETPRLTVIGKHPEKLALLHNRGIEARLRDEVTPDRTAEVVVDCTGSASGIEEAFRWLRPRGTLVLKTTVAGRPSLALAPIVIDEFHVVGSRCGPFAPALAALADGSVDVLPLIQARFPLRDGLAGFRLIEERPVMKVVFEVGA